MAKKPETLTTLGKKLYDLKAEKDQLEDRLKVVNAQKDELEKQTIPKMMEEQEQDKFSVTGMGTIYLQPEIQVSIKKDNEGGILTWFKGHGHAAIVKETVHPGTLKSWTKEQLENGGELPPDLSVHQYMRAVMRRK